MEKQLFSWNEWVQPDLMVFVFYHCKLKRSIGGHVAGAVYPQIDMDYEHGEMTLHDGEGHVEVFDLTLTASARSPGNEKQQLCPPSIFTTDDNLRASH